MSIFARLAGAMLLVATPAPLRAQEAPADPMATVKTSAAEQVAAAREPGNAPAAVAPACKPKKKKGFGLGGILKAASKSGLTSMVGGGLIGGYGGAIASTAVNTGVSVSEGAKPNPKPAAEGC